MKKTFTYNEIAEMSGTSVGTVSRYFNNYSISETAKLKIKKVLNEIDYVPNFSASKLRRKNEQIKDLILILPYNINQVSYREIVIGADECCKKYNSNLFVHISDSDSYGYKKEIEKILLRNPYGLILLLPRNFSKELYDFLISIRTSKIMIYDKEIKKIREDDTNYNSVMIDDYEIMNSLTKKVAIDHKEETITYIGLDESDLTTGLLRKKAFVDNIKKEYQDIYLIDDNSIEETFKIMKKIIDKNNSKIIVAGTHTIALGVSLFLNEKNLRKKYLISDVGVRNIDTDYIIKPDYFAFIDYCWIGYSMVLKLLDIEKNRIIQNYRILP